MDNAERLADYLAGELDADERAALEAALARDPALRAQLGALQRADASLAGLSSPTPPEGFEARLEARLDDELGQILDRSTLTATPSAAHVADAGADAGAAASAGRGDELAERRARRQPPRWVVATSAAAAALVIVAGGGIVISQIVGSGNDAGDESTGDGPMQTLESDDDAADTADDAAPESADGEAASGPLIVASDRDLDDAAVATLIDGDAPLDLADRGLSRESAAQLRGNYLEVFGAEAPEAAADSDAAEAEEEEEDAGDEAQAGSERTAGDLALETAGDVSDDDLADVARCLAELAEDSPDALPVYAELATRDGEGVIALGLVTEDPQTGAFTRREVWVLSRTTCEPRYFAQR